METSPENMSVLLQFAKFSKGYRISDFGEFIEESIGVQNLDFFGRLAYPNQWQIRLTNKDLREKMIRIGRSRVKNRACWIYPLNPQEIRGFVHWLPNSVNNDQLKEQLQLYGDVLFVESQERTIRGQKVESDQRYYGLILSHGTIKEDLPHFLKINGFMCLLVVRGREPACFHCKEVGHRQAECSKYKAKLIGYCNREPNTSQPRLRPRGKRCEKDETGRNEVSFSHNISCLKGQVSNSELNYTHLSASEDHEHTEAHGEEVIDSNERELMESVLSKSNVESFIDNSAASFSETYTQIKDILETLQEFQRRTREDLQLTLKNYEKEFSMAFTRGTLSTRTGDQIQSTVAGNTFINLDQEMNNEELEMKTKEIFTSQGSIASIEMVGNDSNAGTGINETKDAEIQSELPAMHQVKVGTEEGVENIHQKSEEKPKYTQSASKDSTGNADTERSFILMLKEPKQDSSETAENTFNKLEEFVKDIKASEELLKSSATDTDSKLTEEEVQNLLGMVKQARTNATGYSEETFKKIESLMSEGSFDMEEKLFEDDKCFAKQMLEKTKENTMRILENTFIKVEEKVVVSAEKSQTTTKNVLTQPDVSLEQLKQDVSDTVKYVCEDSIETENSDKASSHYTIPEGILQTEFNILKEGMEAVEETESIEKAFSRDTFTEEIIETESDIVVKIQEEYVAPKVCLSSEEIRKETTEKAFSAKKEMQSNVSGAFQGDIDKIQTNLKKIFSLLQVNMKLLPETRRILSQVESEVIEVVEGTKIRWKMGTE